MRNPTLLRGLPTFPTTQISDISCVRQFPPHLVYFPCFRHFSSPKWVLPISTTIISSYLGVLPMCPTKFYSVLRQNVQPSSPTKPTTPTTHISDKYHTHFSDKNIYSLLRQLYPAFRRRYFTHFSDILPSSLTKIIYPLLWLLYPVL